MLVQAMLRDLLDSPYGRLKVQQHQSVALGNFLESIEQTPMASASIAQVRRVFTYIFLFSAVYGM